jgi:NCS2 family nucleobase:cation symporter-2
MFVSNLTPPIIVAGAAGFGFGSSDPGELIYMIQMSMVFAGIATLFQTIGFGPVGARLPIVQGTSFAFLPVMIPIVAGHGVAAMAQLTTAAMIGGLLHTGLSFFVGRIRFALPPMVTGLVVLMIGLSLMRVGIQYAAGGVPAQGTPAYGAGESWLSWSPRWASASLRAASGRPPPCCSVCSQVMWLPPRWAGFRSPRSRWPDGS